MALLGVGSAVLIGMVGLAVDVGLVVLAAQQCQTVADTAVLGGAQLLPDSNGAVIEAAGIARSNIRLPEVSKFTIDADFYLEGEVIPQVGPAPRRGALAVTATKQVNYKFLPVLGLQGTTVTRTAAAAHMVTGTCIAPMWVSSGTIPDHGTQMDMHFCDDPQAQSRMHGIFGWLDPAGGVDFVDALKGVITPAQEELQRVNVGDTVWNNPGQRTGHWMKALETDSDSRLNRAEWEKWALDTFESFYHDNPRIMIVPFCEYLDGSGNNARFTITGFGAWWLEEVNRQGQDKTVIGRFIDFAKPGGTAYGLKPTHLIR